MHGKHVPLHRAGPPDAGGLAGAQGFRTLQNLLEGGGALPILQGAGTVQQLFQGNLAGRRPAVGNVLFVGLAEIQGGG